MSFIIRLNVSLRIYMSPTLGDDRWKWIPSFINVNPRQGQGLLLARTEIRERYNTFSCLRTQTESQAPWVAQCGGKKKGGGAGGGHAVGTAIEKWPGVAGAWEGLSNALQQASTFTKTVSQSWPTQNTGTLLHTHQQHLGFPDLPAD